MTTTEAYGPCPLCGADLEECVGSYEEISYVGLRCPNGCDLWEVY